MKQNDALALDVRVNPTQSGDKVKAYASVNIGGAFAIKNIRIIKGSKGLFVAMPSVKNHKGEYDDIFFPITKESRKAFNDTVLTAYEQSMEMAKSHEQEQKTEPEMSM